MALRLRRGTDSERLLITPAEGELIYTTDTKKLYVGDGVTVGGNPVDTDTNTNVDVANALASLSINDLGDVNADSTVANTGDILAYDAASGDWRATPPGELTELNSLSDVNLAGVLDGEIIAFNSVSGNFENQQNTLLNLSDVNLAGVLDGEIIAFNSISGNFENQQNTLLNLKDFDETTTRKANSVIVYNESTGLYENSDVIKVDLYSDDSSILVDAATGQFYGIFNGTLNGTHIGTLEGNVLGGDIQANNGTPILTSGTDGTDAVFTGSMNGVVFGELIGSVFGENSSLLIDAVNGTVTADLATDRLVLPSASSDFVIEKSGDTAALRLSAVYTTDESASTSTWGQILFELNDSNGQLTPGIIGGQTGGIYIASDSTGTFADFGKFSQFKEGSLKLGGFNPAEKLDVDGNAVVSGFVQFGSLTTAERNALTAAAGMVIWNSTTTQFEGFDGTNWINLVDGVTSP